MIEVIAATNNTGPNANREPDSLSMAPNTTTIAATGATTKAIAGLLYPRTALSTARTSARTVNTDMIYLVVRDTS
jgi:hypothetical protein